MSVEDIKDWNQIADSYVQGATADNFINKHFTSVLWESLGDVHGLAILDLGCGSGWLSQQLHEAGAEVLGVDGSIALVEMARSAFPDIEFIEYDLSQGLPPLSRTFDFIVANMLLMDIPDITNLMRSVREALAPSGKFIFTMQHPCFFNIKSHRDENDRLFGKLTGYLKPEVWRIESFGGHNHYHRSLTFYFDHLRQQNLAVTRLYEPARMSRSERSEADNAYYENVPFLVFIEAIAI